MSMPPQEPTFDPQFQIDGPNIRLILDVDVPNTPADHIAAILADAAHWKDFLRYMMDSKALNTLTSTEGGRQVFQMTMGLQKPAATQDLSWALSGALRASGVRYLSVAIDVAAEVQFERDEKGTLTRTTIHASLAKANVLIPKFEAAWSITPGPDQSAHIKCDIQVQVAGILQPAARLMQGMFGLMVKQNIEDFLRSINDPEKLARAHENLQKLMDLAAPTPTVSQSAEASVAASSAPEAAAMDPQEQQQEQLRLKIVQKFTDPLIQETLDAIQSQPTADATALLLSAIAEVTEFEAEVRNYAKQHTEKDPELTSLSRSLSQLSMASDETKYYTPGPSSPPFSPVGNGKFFEPISPGISRSNSELGFDDATQESRLPTITIDPASPRTSSESDPLERGEDPNLLAAPPFIPGLTTQQRSHPLAMGPLALCAKLHQLEQLTRAMTTSSDITQRPRTPDID